MTSLFLLRSAKPFHYGRLRQEPLAQKTRHSTCEETAHRPITQRGASAIMSAFRVWTVERDGSDS